MVRSSFVVVLLVVAWISVAEKQSVRMPDFSTVSLDSWRRMRHHHLRRSGHQSSIADRRAWFREPSYSFPLEKATRSDRIDHRRRNQPVNGGMSRLSRRCSSSFSFVSGTGMGSSSTGSRAASSSDFFMSWANFSKEFIVSAYLRERKSRCLIHKEILLPKCFSWILFAIRSSTIYKNPFKGTTRLVYSTYNQRSPVILMSNASSKSLIQCSIRLWIILKGKDASPRARARWSTDPIASVHHLWNESVLLVVVISFETDFFAF